jgi:anti-sigma factor RsiW
MNCRELAEILIDYLADELSAEQAEHIRRHLAECSPCVFYVQTYELTVQLTRRLPAVAPPAHLLERLRAAARQQTD